MAGNDPFAAPLPEPPAHLHLAQEGVDVDERLVVDVPEEGYKNRLTKKSDMTDVPA